MGKRNLYLKTIPVEEAQALYQDALKAIAVRRTEKIPVEGSLGRMTAKAIYARCCSPLFNAAAMDGIAVIVNADSPVADLTVEQIAQIFTGEITDWSEVGGDAGEIACIGREANSGTRDGFESITDTEDACVLSQELNSTGAVIQAVASSPNAIGYASLSAVEGQEGIKAITVGGVACTEETVKDGTYEIQRPFVFVTKEGTELSEAAQAFLDYAMSDEVAEQIAIAGAVAP